MSKSNRLPIGERTILEKSIFPMILDGNCDHAREIIANKKIPPEETPVKTAILAIAAQIAPARELRRIIKPLTDELAQIRKKTSKQSLVTEYQKSEFFQILTAIPDEIIDKYKNFTEENPELIEDIKELANAAGIVTNIVQLGLDPTGLSALKIASNLAANLLSDIEIENDPMLTEILHMIGAIAQVASIALDFIAPDFGTLVTIGTFLVQSGIFDDLQEHLQDLFNDEKEDAKDQSPTEELTFVLAEEIKVTNKNLKNIPKVEKEGQPDLSKFKEKFISAISKNLNPDQQKELLKKVKEPENFDETRTENRIKMLKGIKSAHQNEQSRGG